MNIVKESQEILNEEIWDIKKCKVASQSDVDELFKYCNENNCSVIDFNDDYNEKGENGPPIRYYLIKKKSSEPILHTGSFNKCNIGILEDKDEVTIISRVKEEVIDCMNRINKENNYSTSVISEKSFLENLNKTDILGTIVLTKSTNDLNNLLINKTNLKVKL